MQAGMLPFWLYLHPKLQTVEMGIKMIIFFLFLFGLLPALVIGINALVDKFNENEQKEKT